MDFKRFSWSALIVLMLSATAAHAAPPQVVSISPKPGSNNVDTQTTAIVVTFDQDMGGGMSWTGGGPHFPKTDESEKSGWVDKRTCVLAVDLAPAMVYRLGLNSTSFQNFRSEAGEPLAPQTIIFATTGVSDEDVAMMTAPKATTFDPLNGAEKVNPTTDKLSVTFDQPMGGGMSWTGGGENFPETTGKAQWSQDKRTCTIPVKLKPNHSYNLGINSVSHKNFSNNLGDPAEPMVYEFSTGN